jgi:immunity protein, SdpI family
MRIGRTNLLSLGLVILAFAITAALYHRLPESVPVHWDVRGEPNGFMSKPWGPFMLPLVMAGVHLVLTVIPSMSPRGYRIERFQRVFEILQAAVLAFLFFVTVIAVLAGIGAPVPMDRAMLAGVGLLLVVVGNFMGKLTKNFFVGIRTPWTLASDEVWLRTHRLGGKLFVLAGGFLFIAGLVHGGAMPMLAAAVVAGGIPAVFSYVCYRRIEGRKHGATDEDTPQHST